METIILLLSVLMVYTIALTPIPTSITYEPDDVIDYGDRIFRKSRKCSDEVLFDFQREYPNTTEFLANVQLIRNFHTAAYNSCKQLMKGGGPDCLEEWKAALANTFNEFTDRLVKILPQNGESEYKRLIAATNKCIVRDERK